MTKKILLILAVLVFLLAWGRVTWMYVENVPPPMYAAFVDHDGAKPAQLPACRGPAFAAGDEVWMLCDASPGATGKTPLFVRFDLALAKAEAMWPLPGEASNVRALDRHAGGDLLVVMDSGMQVFRLKSAGGVESLGTPEAGSWLAGAAFVGDTPVVVTGGFAPARIHEHLEGQAWRAREVVPIECGADMLCRLELAMPGKGGWRFVYTRVPTHPVDPVAVHAEILEGTRTEAPVSTGRIELPSGFFNVQGGTFSWLAEPLEPSPANRVGMFDIGKAPPFERKDSKWVAYKDPNVAALKVQHAESDYLVGPEHLAWIPREDRNPTRVRLGGKQLSILRDRKGISLDELGGAQGQPLASDSWLDGNARLLPATAGGYWLLGSFGAHVRTDAALNRADAPGFLGRLLRVFANFGRLESFDDFYLELVPLKIAVLPFVLLFLPLMLLVVLIVRMVRRSDAGWGLAIALACVPYLAGAAAAAPWFWTLTELL